MTETDAEFLNRYWTELNWDTDDADFDRLFTLARRGAAAGELLEASKEILGMAEGYLNIMPDRHGTRIAKLAAARAAIAQFEATAATQESMGGENG